MKKDARERWATHVAGNQSGQQSHSSKEEASDHHGWADGGRALRLHVWPSCLSFVSRLTAPVGPSVCACTANEKTNRLTD